jgi:protein-tyrosine-phosphatase
VPDPYYGGHSGFSTVLEQVERSCAGLLAALELPVPQQTDSPPR